MTDNNSRRAAALKAWKTRRRNAGGKYGETIPRLSSSRGSSSKRRTPSYKPKWEGHGTSPMIRIFEHKPSTPMGSILHSTLHDRKGRK